MKEKLRAPAVCAGIALLVWLIYGQTLGFGFVDYDDGAAVFKTPEITAGLTWSGLRWAFTHAVLGHWDPLTTLSHMLDCRLYGVHPWGHHLTNVILHAFAAILLFLVLRALTGAFWRSALVAALFAVHPLRVESVSWITERKDVLSGVFFMLTLGAYVGYVRHRTIGRYAAVAALFVCALLAKSMVVTLPLVLLLLDGWPLGRWNSGRRAALWPLLREKLPLLGISAIFSYAQLRAAREMIAPLEALPMGVRIENALVSYVEYLWQMLWPARLTVYYPHPGETLALWHALLAFLLLAAISLAAWWRRREQPYLLTGWLWFLGMLAPVIGLVQSSDIARADRYTYLPEIGFALALVWLLPAPRRVAAVAWSGALALLVWWSAVQATFWRDSESLWRHALQVTSGNHVAENNLGLLLLGRGETGPAISLFEAALRHKPGYSLAEGNLGNALAMLGRLEDALPHYLRALTVDPRRAEIHSDAGHVLLKLGRLKEALAQCQTAVELRPGFRDGLTNLGNVLLALGQTDQAILRYRQALAVDPELAEAHSDLGQALLKKGRRAEAMAHLRQAVELSPRLVDARLNLAEALLDAGDPAAATAELQATLAFAPGSERVWNDLGLAAAATGRFAAAADAFAKAVASRPESTQAEANLAAALLRLHRAAEAVPHYRRILALQPANAGARNNLAWILATTPDDAVRDGAAAVELARGLGPSSARHLKTLGAALAETRQFAEAIEVTGRALALAARAEPEQAPSLRAMLDLFHEGRPCRDASLGSAPREEGK